MTGVCEHCSDPDEPICPCHCCNQPDADTLCVQHCPCASSHSSPLAACNQPGCAALIWRCDEARIA